jgi:acetyl-CoA acetyltransferase family protein
MLHNAIIYDAVRTPIGKKNGMHKDLHPTDLGAIVVKSLVSRNGLHPSDINDLIFGCVTQINDQGWNIARNIGLAANLGISVPGTTINRLCASSLQACNFGAQSVACHENTLVIAGGVESMSRVAMGSDSGTFPESITDIYELVNQGLSAELIVKKYGFTRHDIDTFSIRSHQKALYAMQNGLFANELVGIGFDEGPRQNTDLDKMSRLKSAFSDTGLITAASSSQISDGSAAILIGNDKLNLKPRARFIASVVTGVDPTIMLTGPISATMNVLRKAGLTIENIGLFECNEAFAPVVMAWMKELNIPESKVNVNGGAIALGHPLGCSGARLLVTLLNAMEQRKVRYGLATMCVGMGQGIATIIERL